MRTSPFLIALAVALPGALIGLSGCGGSDGGSKPTSTAGSTAGSVPPGTATTTAVDIGWDSRSRVLAAPSSALSARITFVRAGDPGNGASYVANRDAFTFPYTGTYPSPTAVLSGGFSLAVEFHTERDGAGAVVGRAETGVIVRPDGTLARAEGGPLGFVNYRGTIATVDLAAPAALVVGQTAPLVVTARDAAGAIVAVSPGSVFLGPNGFTNTTGGTTGGFGGGGGPVLTVDGAARTVTGNRPGTAQVQASVDNVASPAVSITVTEAP